MVILSLISQKWQTRNCPFSADVRIHRCWFWGCGTNCHDVMMWNTIVYLLLMDFRTNFIFWFRCLTLTFQIMIFQKKIFKRERMIGKWGLFDGHIIYISDCNRYTEQKWQVTMASVPAIPPHSFKIILRFYHVDIDLWLRCNISIYLNVFMTFSHFSPNHSTITVCVVHVRTSRPRIFVTKRAKCRCQYPLSLVKEAAWLCAESKFFWDDSRRLAYSIHSHHHIIIFIAVIIMRILFLFCKSAMMV